MNKSDLKILIKKFILFDSFSDGVLERLTTNIEGTQSKDVLFYKINESDSDLARFYRKLKGEKPGLVITNQKLEGVEQIQIEKDDFLEVQKILCDSFYPNKETLGITGITGTNGKTTITSLLMQISTQLGVPSFCVGTIGVWDGDQKIYPDPNATTPSYLELRKIIHKFQDDYKKMFLEVSSHALDQKRLYDLELEYASFASFSIDHLDYHKTEKEYLKAKLKIVDFLRKGGVLVVPAHEKILIKKIEREICDTSLLKKTSVIKKRLPLIFAPQYNRNNLEVAVEIAKSFGAIEEINYEKLKMPKGRFETIEKKERIIVIDYAHGPDALFNICKALKESLSKYSLTVVFGCGGDRDKTKRPLMRAAVESFADKIIVTSDNPRREDPALIVDDILDGVQIDHLEVIIDREDAISEAIKTSKGSEIILIAGKGHEEFQEIDGEKIEFSDMKMAERYLGEL